MQHMYRCLENRGASVLVVKDSAGQVFGAFLSESWECNAMRYYGSGESFVFRFVREAAKKPGKAGTNLQNANSFNVSP